MPIAKITPSGVRINTLIGNISQGDIKIPAFQRGFVWSQEQVLALIDSIYRDYPIGSILLWNSKERLTSTRNLGGLLIPERDPDYPVDYVLDGQQRLTTIYGVFCPDKQLDERASKDTQDPSIFELYFDLREERFLSVGDLEGVDSPPSLWSREDPSYFKLSTIFVNREFLDHLRRIDTKYLDLISSLQDKFQNYEVPVVTIKERNKEEVGTIFERINNTATKLSTLDLMIAWTWRDDFDLREKIREILNSLDEKGFGKIPEKRILQCLSAIINETTTTKAILDLEPITVRDNIGRLRSSLEQTVDYLSTQLSIQSIDFLPHSHQLVPLTYLFSKGGISSDKINRAIRHWFWSTSFSNRYAGSTDSRMDDDISFFSKVLSGTSESTEVLRYSPRVSKTAIIDKDFGIASPITRAFLLLLAQRRPRNLINGLFIDTGKSLSSFNRKEFHHIFPKAYLRKTCAPKNVDSLCNFCFLPAGTNKEISDRPPSQYLYQPQMELYKSAARVSRDNSSLEEILHSNLMPLSKDIYLENDYQRFLDERAKIILEFLGSQLIENRVE